MDRNELIKRFETIQPISRKEIDDSLVATVDANMADGFERGHRDIIIVMEELAELIQELSKELRGKGDSVGVLEELADVQLGIYNIQQIFGVEDVDLQKAMAVKVERVSAEVGKTGMYK